MILKNATIAYGQAFGNIYNDEKGRFADGDHIRTSLILEEWTDADGKKFIRTRNNVYEIQEDTNV